MLLLPLQCRQDQVIQESQHLHLDSKKWVLPSSKHDFEVFLVYHLLIVIVHDQVHLHEQNLSTDTKDTDHTHAKFAFVFFSVYFSNFLVDHQIIHSQFYYCCLGYQGYHFHYPFLTNKISKTNLEKSLCEYRFGKAPSLNERKVS